MVWTRLWPTLGLALDGLSGLAFLALGAVVLYLAPRRRLNVAFAIFAASFGLFYLLHNMVDRADPSRVAFDTWASPFGILAGPALVVVALWSAPLPRGRRLALWLAPGVAAAAFAGLFTWGWFDVLLPTGAAYTLGVASIQIGMTFALFLLATRFVAAEGAAAGRERDQAALLSGAIVIFPGVQTGMLALLGSPLWVLSVPGLAASVALCAFWIANTRQGTPRESGGARNVALVTLAAPLVGMLVALVSANASAALDSGFLGIARLAMVTSIAYGVLRYQLFGIDLRVKWTLRRGTVLGALAVTFFVAKEGLEASLPGEGPVAGIAGAAIVAALAYPLWRSSARLADKMMPDVADTDEYRRRRARDVYQAALEDVLRDGTITPKERDILDGLRRNLGLTVAETSEMERAPAAIEVTP